MDKFQIEETWNKMKAKLQQQYAMLTEDDLQLIDGREDEILNRMEKRLGKTREEVKQVIKSI